jgi:TRAP-type C4-dicarboxylate transport system permease small subunit
VVRVITNAFAAVVAGFLANAAWGLVISERQSPNGDLLPGVPEWVGLAIIPVGYALLVIHFSINVAINALQVAGKGEEA